MSAPGAIHEARWPLKIGLGVAASLPGIVLRLALEQRLFDHLPYQVYYVGFIVASLLGGLLPGVAAASASTLWVQLWSTPLPVFSAGLRLALFLCNSLANSGLAEARHRALWRLGEAGGKRAEAEKILIASEKFRLTQAAEPIAAFDLDIEGNAAKDAPAASLASNLEPWSIPGQCSGSPEDVAKIKAAAAASTKPTTGFDGQAMGRSAGSPPAAKPFSRLAAICMIGICRDVTGERTVERALRKSQAQVRMLVEHAPISIAMFDRDMVYLAASCGWIENYGDGRDSLVGLSHYKLHSDIPDRWRAIHRGVLKGEFHSNVDDYWIDGAGKEHWVRWAAYP